MGWFLVRFERHFLLGSKMVRPDARTTDGAHCSRIFAKPGPTHGRCVQGSSVTRRLGARRRHAASSAAFTREAQCQTAKLGWCHCMVSKSVVMT